MAGREGRLFNCRFNFFINLEPPKFSQTPKPKTVTEGDSVVFTCNATGSPAPSLVWYKDDNELTHSNSRFQISNDNSTLKINEVSREDQGRYRCNASNFVGSSLSPSATLIVNFLQDVFISTPQPYILSLGEKKTSLHCHANGFPHPVLSWYKEGTPVLQNKSILTKVISRTKITTQLILVTKPEDGVSYEEAGNYTCVAHSSVLNKTTGRTVEVLFKPEIQYEPKDQTAIKGTQASFYCNATGIPEPVITWRFSGSSIPISTDNNIVIRSLQNTKKYEGRYMCVARSRAGKAEASALLTVDVPPTIKMALLKGVMFQLGKTLRLKCDVYGDPEPLFLWRKSGEPKDKGEILPSQTKSELVIPDIRLKDAAYYGCTAKNRAGSVSLDDVFIDVKTSLEIINKGEKFNSTAESATFVRCIASSEITPVVQLLKDGVKLMTRTTVSKDKKVVRIEFILSRVTTEDSGRYTCVAKNRQKEVKAHFPLSVLIPIKVELDVSLNQTFTEELRDNSSEAYLNLTNEFIQEMTNIYQNETGFLRIEVLGLSNGSISVQFRIIYKIEVKTPEEKPPPDTTVRIANVLVRKVINTAGIVGNLVLKPETLKPRVKPPAPRNLTVSGIKKTTVTIEWSPPLYNKYYSIQHYVVKYKKFGSSWQEVQTISEHVNTLVMDDLEADTSYSIKIHANNREGEGLSSKIIEVKTLSDFMDTFAKVLIPTCILLVVGVIVLVYLRYRQKRSQQAKLNIEEEQGKRYYDEFLHEPKRLDFERNTVEMVELPLLCRDVPREILMLDKELGSGQFGVVFKGFLKEKEKDNEVPCAVKMLKPGASDQDYRDLFNELEIMSSVTPHPNIINLLGACKGGDGPLYVIVEFAENGCLLEYLRQNRHCTLDDGGNKEEVSSLKNKEKIRIALDIANGMKHLASHKCVHRDLAARNVLLGKDLIAKVADFGLARDIYEQGFYEKSSSGGKLPAKWMSIEALETMKATSQSDVWSFGVLLWEIESGGRIPYAGLSYLDLLKVLKSGVRLPKQTNCSEEMYSIMKDCWKANPENRPTFDVLSLILDNLFMAYIDD